ncbi:unnamed protein product [Dovyalis caffra]|uniref:3'-5' exonuclease domain-containing protein n=1 Tax=Dovyalis caffra TaxID=77055 RepID=A0AAV1RDC5_9ROSI|nr:unnamed protein product [Dovyalis caffra]
MSFSIEEVRAFKSWKLYEVTLHDRVVETTVTSSAKVAGGWINNHLQAPCHHHKKIVGLDIEWRPSFTKGVQNPVAVLQLCIRKCCLIFQIYQASHIPRSLRKALKNPNITYTGVRISCDVKKLCGDYDLEVSSAVNVACLAANEFEDKEYKKAGLKTLVEEIIGEEMEKPKHVAMSKWDAKNLSFAQVKYACADAYYSYKLGKILTDF